MNAEGDARQLSVVGHRWVVGSQSARVVSIEILQSCLGDGDDLSLNMRKFGMVLENERRRPRLYWFIPADGRGLLT